MMRVILAALIFCMQCCTPNTPAFARDYGQWKDVDPEIAQWYRRLMMPDRPTTSCCGESDAYYADESFTKNGEMYAVVTDDRDDAVLMRAPVPFGTVYKIPPEKITRQDGNPTGHVILFLSSGNIWTFGQNNNSQRIPPEKRSVLCFVMNGGV